MSIFRKLENKFRDTVMPSLVRFSVVLNQPALTAQILVAATQRMNESGQYTVLCLRRSVFMDDVQAMIRYSGQIRYLVLERRYFRVILLHFLSETGGIGLTESNYHEEEETAAVAKRKYFAYLQKLFPILQKKLGMQAIFAGNFGYLEQQELMKVAVRARVPFIVLHKEGMAVQSQYLEHASIYRHHRFLGTRLLVYNERIKRALLKVGVAGMSEQNVFVVGVPRLDPYFREKLGRGSPKHVAFFSFLPRDKFHYITDDKAVIKKIEKRSIEFHALVLEFARRHPDFQIVIKTKFAEHYLKYMKNIVQNFGGLTSNVEITNTIAPEKLIASSQSVVGFTSTTLIEAIAAGRLVVSPYFGDLVRDKAWDYFYEYPDLVCYVKNYTDLEKYLLNPEVYLPPDGKQVREFLTDLIHNVDGQAGRRAEDLIIQAIRQYA